MFKKLGVITNKTQLTCYYDKPPFYTKGMVIIYQGIHFVGVAHKTTPPSDGEWHKMMSSVMYIS